MGSESPRVSASKPNHMRDTINGQRATIAKLFEQGTHQALLLLSEDVNGCNHFGYVLMFHSIGFMISSVLFLAVGLHKILSLLESEDVDVRVHAVKVVANLAAEGKIRL